MSKGPGLIQRSIADALATRPERAFTVAELCRDVYGVDAVEKKHRVAVIRALRRMTLPDGWIAERRGHEMVVHQPGAKPTRKPVSFDLDEFDPKSIIAEVERRLAEKKAARA